MNLYDKIREDHSKIGKICTEIKKIHGIRPDKLKDYFENLKKELILHNKAEEDTLYDYLKDHDQAQITIDESLSDHKEIEHTVTEVCNLILESSPWEERFKYLEKLINNHIHKEERDTFRWAMPTIHRHQESELAERYDSIKKRMKEEYDNL